MIFLSRPEILDGMAWAQREVEFLCESSHAKLLTVMHQGEEESAESSGGPVSTLPHQVLVTHNATHQRNAKYQRNELSSCVNAAASSARYA